MTYKGDVYTVVNKDYIVLLTIVSSCVTACLRMYHTNRLVGLVVKASASGAVDLGLSRSSHTGDLKMSLQWLPCQAPGIKGSALGLVGLVSVYCDWVR